MELPVGWIYKKNQAPPKVIQLVITESIIELSSRLKVVMLDRVCSLVYHAMIILKETLYNDKTMFDKTTILPTKEWHG